MKKRVFGRWLSVLLAVCLLAGTLSAPVWA